MDFTEWQKEEGAYSVYGSSEFMMIMEKYNTRFFFNSERQKRDEKKKRMNKMFRFSDVKWLKQFLFKCKFDFLKDGTTSNCTLNGKMKINLKYGMNKVYVDFLGIIFYYENPDAFSLAQSILDFGQLWLGWNANIFNLFKHQAGRLTRSFPVHSNQISPNNDQQYDVCKGQDQK